MPALAETPAAKGYELNKMQQLAALLVMLGPESSAQILRHFQSHEVESISCEMARVSTTTREQREAILLEFAEVVRATRTSRSAGAETRHPVPVEPIPGVPTGESARRPPSPVLTAGFRRIAALSAREIFNLLQAELPQTVALILSHLSPEKAAQVSALFPPDLRDRIIERLATLKPTPSEVVDNIVEVLNARLNDRPARNPRLRHEIA